MINSTRLRLATTPDDETPGAVPPPDDATIPVAPPVITPPPAAPVEPPAAVVPPVEPAVPPVAPAAAVPPVEPVAPPVAPAAVEPPVAPAAVEPPVAPIAPEVPVAAPVAPAAVTPPVAPAAVGAPPVGPPQPGAPVYAQPAGAPKSNKGLLIGFIAGGAVVVIAIIVALVLVLPMIFGGSTTSSANVNDIGAEPETTWKYDWVGDADTDFISDAPKVVGVGDDLALVWAEFDQYAYEDNQGDSAGWYEGYDEQYDLGYAAGLEYLVQYDAALADTPPYTIDFPSREDFAPTDYEQYSDEWLGFDDGFDDARYGDGEGYSQKEAPVDPDYTPTITLLNTATGDDAWTVDIADIIDGADFSTAFTAQGVSGSSTAVISAVVKDEDTSKYVVSAISTSNGEVLSTLESDGPVSVTDFDGDLIVTASNEDGETTVSRFAVDGLDDDAKWETDGPDSLSGAIVSALGDQFLQVSGEEEGLVLLADSGEEADFGDDVDFSVKYGFAGSQLVRLESSEDSTEIEGWNTNDDSTWKSVDAGSIQLVDGSIFSYETDGDAYSELMAINPANGENRWENTYDDEFDGVYGVHGDNVLVASGTSLVVLSLSNGEEKFTQKLGDVSGVWEGENQYYVSSSDELSAYNFEEKGDVWTFDLDEGQTVAAFGRNLGIVDSEKGELLGLK